MSLRILMPVSWVAVLAISLQFFTPASLGALTLSSTRDCDDNAVLRCGAMTTNELQSKYQNQNAQPIFSYFGISQQEINSMDSSAVAGQVTRDGQVKVGGKVVATNAMTAGRQNMAGSTKVNSGGQTFYARPTGVSFQSQSLPAFVVMKNGIFQYAVIASCGNPVKATPVRKPVAKTPVTKQQVVEKETLTQTVVVEQPPAPPPAPAPQPVVIAATTPPPAAPTPAPKPAKSLPDTGAGSAVGLGVFAAIASAVAHNIYQRRRLV